MIFKVFVLALVFQLAYSAPFERELQELAKDLQSIPTNDEFAFADYDDDLKALDNEAETNNKRSMTSQEAETIYKNELLKQDEIKRNLANLMKKTKALKDMLRNVEKDVAKQSHGNPGSHLRKAADTHYHHDQEKIDDEIQKQLHDSMLAHNALSEKIMEEDDTFENEYIINDIDQEENDGDKDNEDEENYDDDEEGYDNAFEDEEEDEEDEEDEEEDEEEEEDEKEDEKINQLFDHLSNLKEHVKQLKDSLTKAKEDTKGAEPADVSNEINNEINKAITANEEDTASDKQKRMLNKLKNLHAHLDQLKDSLKDSTNKRIQKKKADPNTLHMEIEKLKRDILKVKDVVVKTL